jgi:hypothetical protein
MGGLDDQRAPDASHVWEGNETHLMDRYLEVEGGFVCLFDLKRPDQRQPEESDK